MKKTMHWIAAMMALAIGPAAHAAGGEVVHVNLARILEAHQRSEPAAVQLREEIQQKKKEFDIKKAELDRMRESLDKEKESLSEGAREKKEQAISDKNSELMKIVSATQRDLQGKEEILKVTMSEKVRSALGAVGQENGYRYILDGGERTVLYADDSADVTDAVLKKLVTN